MPSKPQTEKSSGYAPYEPGEIVAIGYMGGQEACRHNLRTAEEPHALRLFTDPGDREDLRRGSDDLAFIGVEVIDKNGSRVFQASHAITFGIEGPGELVALDNGDLLSNEAYRKTRVRSAFKGRCMAVVRTTGDGDTITIRASAEGLGSGEYKLKAVEL